MVRVSARITWFTLAISAGVPSVCLAAQEALPQVVAPRLLGTNGDTSDCYPESSVIAGREGRVVVTLTVQPDGRVTDVRFPVGTERWQEQTVRCMLPHLSIAPGTRDGVPVVAEAYLPFQLAIRGASGTVPEFDSPAIRSDAATVEAARRDCYPAGATETQTPVYRFTVGVDGRARNVKLLKSGGDPRLDGAGACIVKKLRFRPLLRGSQAVKSTVSYPLEVRPPAS